MTPLFLSQRTPTKSQTIRYMSLCVRKPTICMGENKDADQLRGNREADQRLCFRYTDSTFPPLLIPKFSRSWVSSVTVQAGLCWTWSETQIVGFLMHMLIFVKWAKVALLGGGSCTATDTLMGSYRHFAKPIIYNI